MAENELSKFEGTWTLLCGGKTAVFATFKPDRHMLTGSIGIGNMRGDEPGNPIEVYDEPDEKHAWRITSARLESGVLRLEAGPNRKLEFKLTGKDTGRLTFLNADPAVRPVFLLTKTR